MPELRQRTASPSCSTSAGSALSSMELAKKLETLARRRKARGALPDRRRGRPRRGAARATADLLLVLRPRDLAAPAGHGRCLPSNCSARPRSLRTTPIIAKVSAMRASALLCILSPLLAASAACAGVAGSRSMTRSKQARSRTGLGRSADGAAGAGRIAGARDEAERLHAEQAAAAQAIDAAEARISAADAQLAAGAAAYVAAYRQRLAVEQQPVSSLLAGLATMARRPPLLVLCRSRRHRRTRQGAPAARLDHAGDPQPHQPAVRAARARRSGLQHAALAARSELTRSRDGLVARRQRYAALEQKAVRQRSLPRAGRRSAASDVAMAAGEDVERLRGEEASSQSIRRVADLLAAEDPAPPSPFAPERPAPRPPFAYQLPAAAPVTEGLGAVNDSGVRSRGIDARHLRAARRSPPRPTASCKFAGPFRDYDGVLIIDHGGGWLTPDRQCRIVASSRRPGARSASRSAARSGRWRSNCPRMGVESRLLSSQVHLKTCQRATKGG